MKFNKDAKMMMMMMMMMISYSCSIASSSSMSWSHSGSPLKLRVDTSLASHPRRGGRNVHGRTAETLQGDQCAIGRPSVLRIRGGEGIFDEIDKMGQSIMGNGLWKFVKLAIGWREKVQHTVEEDLEICRKITSRHVKKSNMVDRKFLYFISQGPTFFANPVTYLLRYMRGAEVQVAKAVSFLNENKDKLSTSEMKEHLSKAESKGGLGLTPARVSEALFRASIQVEEQQEEEDNKKHFVEEEDEELAAYQKKLEKSDKGPSSTGENKKIHKLATQK